MTDTLERLRFALAERYAIDRGFTNSRFFAECDPFLARLRGDPRFEALMDRARAKQQELEVTP